MWSITNAVTTRTSLAVLACCTLAAYAGATARAISVALAVGAVFVLGVRHGFAWRHGRRLSYAQPAAAAWIVAIGALIAFEAYEICIGSTTATAVMVPVLTVPAVRIVALALWARLGWQLARS
jgi:hypothetical protein